MQAAAEKNDRLLMIGFVRRFGNDAKIIMDFKEKISLVKFIMGKRLIYVVTGILKVGLAINLVQVGATN